MATSFVLETDRLKLRHLRKDDADFIMQLVNSEGWISNIGDRNIHDQVAAKAYIQSITDQYSTNALALSCIVRKSDSRPIGIGGTLQRDYLPDPDVGYALLPEAYGQGYASEMVASVIAAYFEQTKNLELLAIVKSHNKASIRLLQKLDFTESSALKTSKNDDLVFSLRK